ncbi:MAG: phenylalanine--tRNA ligase subunit beta [Bacteroidales bacterium]
MKISYNWLKQYTDIAYTPEQLAAILTDTGLEVSGTAFFETVKGGLDGVLVGKVLSCEKHPNADKLSVTKVDIGKGQPLPIVCGAPNVDKNQKVLVATVGTTLYPAEDKPFPIKKAKIRGEVSEGMICAEDELGLGSSHDGIIVLDEDSDIGLPASAYFDLEKDWVFDIDLTPNRADATSHIGVARDIVAAVNRLNPDAQLSLKMPPTPDIDSSNTTLQIPVTIDNQQACPRYSALTISGISIGDSPAWLQNKLKAIGIRPVNNIVDATNYVMLETGQPLHPFDAHKIKGGQVIIKNLPQNTPFTTLDGVRRQLSADDLMICDAEGPMCIAGVFGGIDSGITKDTEAVFLESAFFNPRTIRKTSKRHQLQTDASFRYERGADPNVTVYALKRVADLIIDIAGGEIASPLVDENPGELEAWTVHLTYDKLDKLAGIKIDRPVIIKILNDLGMDVIAQTDAGIDVLVPTFKVDVKRDVDLIEEILRIYGYNSIPLPEKMPVSLSYSSKPERDKMINLVSDFLTANGFVEVMNNSLTAAHYSKVSKFIDEQRYVSILNPLSRELNVLRQDLLIGGLENIAYNLNRQTPDMMLYELGKTYRFRPESEKRDDVRNRYQEEMRLGIFMTGKPTKESWRKTPDAVDFYDIKHWVYLVLKRFGVEEQNLVVEAAHKDYFSEGLAYRKGKKILVECGRICRKVLQYFDIDQDVYYADVNWDLLFLMMQEQQISYQPLPKYPEVKRDLAMILEKSVSFNQIRALAFEKERKILKELRLFDVYEGDNVPEGKKSYAISFILQDQTKTLTDKQIEKTMKKLQQSFEQKLNAEIRG